jgi:hypothetical protein
MPTVDSTTTSYRFSTDPVLETRFAGKVFRCEATDGLLPLHAAVDVVHELLEWVYQCMEATFMHGSTDLAR